MCVYSRVGYVVFMVCLVVYLSRYEVGLWMGGDQPVLHFCRTCTSGLRAAFEVTIPIEVRPTCSAHLMFVCIGDIQNGLLAAEPFAAGTAGMLCMGARL